MEISLYLILNAMPCHNPLLKNMTFIYSMLSVKYVRLEKKKKLAACMGKKVI